MTDAAKPIILVDGSNFLFRAYHGLPPLTTPNGEPTGAIFGTLNMLRKLISKYEPDKMAVVFDAKGKSFRNDIYPEYKAHRPPMPDDLRPQIEPLHEIIRAMGIPLICHGGVEADDVIGTLATQAAQNDTPVLIVSSDKDLAQLVTENVKLLDGLKYTLRGEDEVIEKFAVRPDQIIDYLALMGDSADNIPGVPSVGPKTAAKWLAEYNTVENIIENAEAIKGKVGEKLRDNFDNLKLSKVLATIDTNVAIEESLETLHFTPANNEVLQEFYFRFNFRRWLEEVGGTTDAPANAVQSPKEDTTPTNYVTILEYSAFTDLISRLAKADCFAIDTETTSLNYMEADLVGISIALQPYEAFYIPIGHDYEDAPQQLAEAVVLDALRPILENPNIGKIGQHIKYDMHIFKNVGISLQGIAHDTMLASYCLNSVATRHDMDSLARHYLGADTVKFTDIAGKGAKQLTFNQIPLQEAAHYAAEDADITLRLHHAIAEQLQTFSGPEKIYQEIEIPTLQVLETIEHQGVLVDVDILGQLSEKHGDKLQQLEQQAHDVAGETFNLSSPSQLQVLLFEKLELPIIKKTPKGAPSTDEEVLEQLANEHPLPKLILEHRSLSKLKNTYTDVLPKMLNQNTGRVHTSYHQATASTGRLSSSDPNLQNIPARTTEGREIRQAFIAPKGYKILAADYSQVELRIMAHLSQDPRLIEAFTQGEDIHKATAKEVFGLNDNGEVCADDRRSAKAINFGLIYGMSAFGLAKQLHIARSQANEYIHSYFAQYPGVKAYMDAIRVKAKSDGFVETILGRRLYLPAMQGRDARAKQAAERLAINAPMQGTAADIIKLAMINVAKALKAEKLRSRMIMQVHDEIVFEAHSSEIEVLSALIQREMTTVLPLSVPLVIDIGCGDNWDEAH